MIFLALSRLQLEAAWQQIAKIGLGDVVGMVSVDHQNGETVAELGSELAAGSARRMTA